MAKAASKIKRSVFNTPSVAEIANFMSKTMIDWPISFCQWYAEKFFYSYVSKGWQINGRTMKSWEAAFHVNSKDLKYDSKKKLEECQMEPIHQANMLKRRKEEAGLFVDVQDQVQNAAKIDLNLVRLAELQKKVIAGEVVTTCLWSEYDGLKRLGIMKVPKAQVDEIMILKGESNERGKSLMVEYLFRNLNHAGMTVKQFYYKLKNDAKKDDQRPAEKNEG